MLVVICLDLEHSVIVGNSINYLRIVRSWLSLVARSVNSAWKRCWHASMDGWAARTFHSRCDGKGPTVTIIRVGKYIFGGYTSISWGKLTIVCTFDTKRSNLRAVANRGEGGGGPGPFEPDRSSLWMNLFSLDSVILIIVTCNCLPFP